MSVYSIAGYDSFTVEPSNKNKIFFGPFLLLLIIVRGARSLNSDGFLLCLLKICYCSLKYVWWTIVFSSSDAEILCKGLVIFQNFDFSQVVVSTGLLEILSDWERTASNCSVVGGVWIVKMCLWTLKPFSDRLNENCVLKFWRYMIQRNQLAPFFDVPKTKRPKNYASMGLNVCHQGNFLKVYDLIKVYQTKWHM